MKQVGGSKPGRVDRILVDARALQDPNYRFRGVGQHSASLLEALRYHSWEGRRPRLVALVDHRAEPLHAEHTALFDEVTTTPSVPRVGTSWLLTLSPMTHDPIWLATLLLAPEIYKVALFYDLIPAQFPERYLRSLESRIDYVICFAWLGRYDSFAAISADTRDGLVQARAVDPTRVSVTGVAVRHALEPAEGEEPLLRTDRKHILVSGGGDTRKNPECAMMAHARLSPELRRKLPLLIFGNYPDSMRANLRKLYADEGGRPDDLLFLRHIPDAELRQIYREAVLTIVPSRAEGFSIPIVESAATGTPVVASDVGAHPELVTDACLRFSPDRPEELQAIINRLIDSDADWTRARDDAARLWPDYTAEAVGRRFIEGVLAIHAATPSAPAVLRNAVPSIAVLTPLPPAASGVADYSAVTLKALSRFADLHVFTDSADVVPSPYFRSLGPVRAASLSARSFDTTLSVIGNSDHHLGIVDHLLQHGGAALAHDARMLGFYYILHGQERALEIGRRETDHHLTTEMLTHWMHNQHELPTPFLSEIAQVASPLIVHSPVTGDEIRRSYGVQPVVLPFAVYRHFDVDDLASSSRQHRRRRLGWADSEIVICSFGFVSEDKAPGTLLWALKLLVDWGIDARLVLCGSVNPDYGRTLYALSESIGLRDRVEFHEKTVSDAYYADCLLAADMAVQLRTYFLGGLSGALNDCIGAALPSVANRHLAEAMCAPDYVRRIPDDLSAVLIAEAFLDIIQSGQHRNRPIAQAQQFDSTHSPEAYATAMMEALGYDVKAQRKAS